MRPEWPFTPLYAPFGPPVGVVDRGMPSGPQPWFDRVAAALGPVASFRSLGGGVWRVEVDRNEVVVKVGSGVLDEAQGLRCLAQVDDGPRVPEVILAEPDLLVTGWIDQGVRSPDQEAALGAMLAHYRPALAAMGWGLVVAR